MKKKLICMALTLALTLSLTMTVLAGEMEITTSITPTYSVTIPADTFIPFEAASTNLGNIELTSAQLEPDYVVTVSASAGELTNDADAAATIPYTLEDENGVFTSAQYAATGDYTTLTVNISQADWDSAYAGSYSGTITFTVTYGAK